jgi:hypothetical protein
MSPIGQQLALAVHYLTAAVEVVARNTGNDHVVRKLLISADELTAQLVEAPDHDSDVTTQFAALRAARTSKLADAANAGDPDNVAAPSLHQDHAPGHDPRETKVTVEPQPDAPPETPPVPVETPQPVPA